MDKQLIIDGLRLYMDKVALSQNKTATQIGIGGATISDILNGKLDRVSDEMWNKVYAHIQPYMPQKWIFVPNVITETIVNVCEAARTRHQMMMIIGEAGISKSATLRRYKLTVKTGNVWYIQCLESQSVNSWLRDVLAEMGIRAGIMSRTDMVRTVAAELKKQPNCLLIIDEAGVIRGKSRLWGVLKDVWNLTEGLAGIVLAGVSYVYSGLQSDAAKEKVNMPEVLSRIAYAAQLPKPTVGICSEIAAKNLPLPNKDAIKAIAKLANGDLRKLRSICEQVATEKGGQITAEEVNQYFR